jgi:hypothetical protein
VPRHPHVNVTLVEDAVERHYSAIRFSQPFIADMRDQIDAMLGEQEKSARLLRKQITAQLKELDTKEENLIDLAADSTLPRTKVKEKLRDIGRERRRLEERLDTANADLTDSAQLVNAGLALLEQARPAVPTLQRPTAAPTQPGDLPHPLHRG